MPLKGKQADCDHGILFVKVPTRQGLEIESIFVGCGGLQLPIALELKFESDLLWLWNDWNSPSLLGKFHYQTQERSCLLISGSQIRPLYGPPLQSTGCRLSSIACAPKVLPSPKSTNPSSQLTAALFPYGQKVQNPHFKATYLTNLASFPFVITLPYLPYSTSLGTSSWPHGGAMVWKQQSPIYYWNGGPRTVVKAYSLIIDFEDAWLQSWAE